jgi:hypothetical protein
MEHKFYSAWMTGPDPDRLRYAQIAGAAARHARAWLTADEEAAAVAELKQTAAGRADLLAECAGTALGFGEGGQDAARYRQIAELCASPQERTRRSSSAGSPSGGSVPPSHGRCRTRAPAWTNSRPFAVTEGKSPMQLPIPYGRE